MKYFGISKRVKKIAECTPRDFDRGALFKEKKETKFKVGLIITYSFENFMNFRCIVNINDILSSTDFLDIYRTLTVIVTRKQLKDIKETIEVKKIEIIEELK